MPGSLHMHLVDFCVYAFVLPLCQREREAFYLMMLLIVEIVNEIRFSGRGIKYEYGPLVDWY